MNRILCMVSHPPYRDGHTAELLDTALVGAVFDCDVSLLFRGEGVWALVKHQDAGAAQLRTVGKILGALASYDISAVYVCAQALAEAGLSPADLEIAAEPLSLPDQASLIGRQDAVLGAQS